MSFGKEMTTGPNHDIRQRSGCSLLTWYYWYILVILNHWYNKSIHKSNYSTTTELCNTALSSVTDLYQVFTGRTQGVWFHMYYYTVNFELSLKGQTKGENKIRCNLFLKIINKHKQAPNKSLAEFYPIVTSVNYWMFEKLQRNQRQIRETEVIYFWTALNNIKKSSNGKSTGGECCLGNGGVLWRLLDNCSTLLLHLNKLLWWQSWLCCIN